MFQIFILFSIICFINSTPIQKSLDWRTKGAVLPVPDQGACKHAGIINALDAISSIYQIKHGKLIQLSQQQVYDCAGNWCPCTGMLGNITDVYKSIDKENTGFLVDSEQAYPWTGKCDHKCQFNKTGTNVFFGGYEATAGVPDEKWIYQIIEQGPVIVEVEANSAFINYAGGIIDDPTCKGDQLNHFLLIVGYGTENGVDYWIARNSWGTSWGEQGYVRIVRDKNMCGIANSIVQPFA